MNNEPIYITPESNIEVKKDEPKKEIKFKLNLSTMKVSKEGEVENKNG